MGWRRILTLIAAASAALAATRADAREFDFRLHPLIVPADAAFHWLDVARVPQRLETDDRWRVDGVRSRRLRAAASILDASVYVVRPSHAAIGPMNFPLAGRVSARALGGDLSLHAGDSLNLLARAAVVEERYRPYRPAARVRAAKTERLLIGVGLELPGTGMLIADYIHVSGGGRHALDRLLGAPAASERPGSGPRLTLTSPFAPRSGSIGWSFTLMSMEHADVRYGDVWLGSAPADRRAELGLRMAL